MMILSDIHAPDGCDPAIQAIGRAWNLGAIHTIRHPPNGTIHRTILIDSDAGSFAIRCYRYTELAPIEREHRLIQHACNRGIPAVAPSPLPSGDAILYDQGRFYALFPFAPGRQIAREQVGIAEAAGLGHMLARLHLALADAPRGLLAPRQIQIDRSAVLADIDRLSALARQGRHPHDPMVLCRLLSQRDYLATLPPEMTVDLADLPFQAIHGDYTETNVFFENHHVCAIIDWDQAYLAPRAWELVRALDLVFHFDRAYGGAFLAAYRACLPLAWEELERAAAAYHCMRAHDLWMYHWIYDRGDDRVRQYINNEGYQPLAPRWAAFRVGYDAAGK